MSETAKRWRIDSDALSLVREDGERGGTFNAQDFRAQEWPNCPVCGEQIEVDRINVQTSQDLFPVFMMGRWQCPNECDPRPALRGLL